MMIVMVSAVAMIVVMVTTTVMVMVVVIIVVMVTGTVIVMVWAVAMIVMMVTGTVIMMVEVKDHLPQTLTLTPTVILNMTTGTWIPLPHHRATPDCKGHILILALSLMGYVIALNPITEHTVTGSF